MDTTPPAQRHADTCGNSATSAQGSLRVPSLCQMDSDTALTSRPLRVNAAWCVDKAGHRREASRIAGACATTKSSHLNTASDSTNSAADNIAFIPRITNVVLNAVSDDTAGRLQGDGPLQNAADLSQRVALDTCTNANQSRGRFAVETTCMSSARIQRVQCDPRWRRSTTPWLTLRHELSSTRGLLKTRQFPSKHTYRFQ